MGINKIGSNSVNGSPPIGINPVQFADFMKVEPIYFDTYLAVIKNSVGSRSFRNFYALIDGDRRDISENGRLSCAYFVSAVLHQFMLIQAPHTTIKGTIDDMEKSGWIKIEKEREGAVLLWEEMDSADGKRHRHLGFYKGGGQAVSNNEEFGEIRTHDWEYGGKRKVEAIYWCLKWK